MDNRLHLPLFEMYFRLSSSNKKILHLLEIVKNYKKQRFPPKNQKKILRLQRF